MCVDDADVQLVSKGEETDPLVQDQSHHRGTTDKPQQGLLLAPQQSPVSLTSLLSRQGLTEL